MSATSRTLLAATAALALLLGGCGGSTTTTTTTVTPTATPTTSVTSPPSAATTSTPSSTTETTATTTSTRRASVPKPHIISDPIPFGPQRKAEMAAYAERHYGISTYRLVHPRVIVIHYTDTPDFQSTFNTFAPDTADSELHELPNTCAHFVIDRDGAIYQLVPLTIMCRHTVGLNWTAIGIEHVGYSDGQVLGDQAQMAASLKLVRWLRCRFHIAIANVIGHNESLSSPYHHENEPALQTQTHGDFVHADMNVYRARLARAGGCGS